MDIVRSFDLQLAQFPIQVFPISKIADAWKIATGKFPLGRINLKIRPPLLQQAAAAQGGAPGVGQVPGGLAQAAPSAAAPAPNAAAPGGGAQNGAPDYSAQWAQYYRSIGKIKEAELIEAQMKNKVRTRALLSFPRVVSIIRVHLGAVSFTLVYRGVIDGILFFDWFQYLFIPVLVEYSSS